MNRIINAFLLCIGLAVVVFYATVAVYYPKLYIFFTYEDLYGEWTQVFWFLAAFIFSLLNALHSSTERFRWFFILLAIATFYTFMEEISWGQRLFGFATPEYLKNNSYQNEANLHNLFTGPVRSWTKTSLTYLISLGLIIYGVIYPIAFRLQWKLGVFLDKKGVASPPLALVPTFFFAAILEMEFFSFNEAEVAELLVAMAMAFTALSFWLGKHPQWLARSLFFFIGMTLAVSVSAYTTTQNLLDDPKQQKRIKSRLAKGYKKFSRRYKHYDHYQAIVRVLQLYDQLKPDKISVLRTIADNYQLSGQPKQARHFIDRAIKVDLKRYTRDPDKVSTNISLAKSYRRINQTEKVNFHGQRAYSIALKRYVKTKGSKKKKAKRAYWLAKACEQVNKDNEALKYFRKAHKLKPSNKRYKKAYFKKRRNMEKTNENS